MPDQPGLFTPVKVGSLELPNRIVMSPMTRIRAGEGCVPSERMVRYYSQRASAGLIITEGTHPSPMGRGYTYPPGLHTEEQAAGWRKVTDAVHAAGGRIFVQLMHAGRVSHSSLLPDHALPVAPSAIAVSGQVHTFDGKVPFETPRPLETAEIPAVIEEYRRAAELSITAGFDGVELHAATGYLPNQFQVTGSNRRTDAYGGSLERRTRFTLEVIEASVRRAGCGSSRHQDRSRLHGQRHLRCRPRRDVHLPRQVSEPAGPGLSSRRLRQRLRARDRPAVQPHRPPPSGVRRHDAGSRRVQQGNGRGGDSDGPGRCRCLCQAVHLQSRSRGEVSARRSLEPLGRADVLRRGRSRLHGLPDFG